MTSNTPSNPPSGRPMTLRQQLEHIVIEGLLDTEITPGEDKPLKYTFPKGSIDQLEAMCQEIAREARIAELKLLVNSVPRARMPESVDYVIQDRIKGLSRLTQKPPQPLADMQSDTSPKADSNQVDNLSPRKEQQ